MHTTQRLCPGITRRFRTHRQTDRRPQHTDHRAHRIRIRIHRHRAAQPLKQGATHRRIISIGGQIPQRIRRAPQRRAQQLRGGPPRTKMLSHRLRHRHHTALQKLEGTVQRLHGAGTITRNRIIPGNRTAPRHHTTRRLQQRVKRAGRGCQQIADEQRVRRR